jgi:hypothetical protein
MEFIFQRLPHPLSESPEVGNAGPHVTGCYTRSTPSYTLLIEYNLLLRGIRKNARRKKLFAKMPDVLKLFAETFPSPETICNNAQRRLVILMIACSGCSISVYVNNSRLKEIPANHFIRKRS